DATISISFNPGRAQLKPGGSTVNKDTPGDGGVAFVAFAALGICVATGGSGGDLGQSGVAGDADASGAGSLEAEGGAGAAGLAIRGYSLRTSTGGGDIVGGTTG